MDNISVFEAKLPAVGEVTDIPPLDTCEARSRHNAAQPIFALPTEILVHILRHLRDVSPLNLRWIFLRSPTKPPWFYHLGWVMATHVCHHLRDVALGDAELWSQISSTGRCQTWLLELLRRSQEASISLDLRPLDKRSPCPELFFKKLRNPPTIRRIQSIKTGDMSTSSIDFLSDLFKHPAPLLERLEISSIQGPNDGSIAALPPSCFRSHAPHLHEILLDCIPFFWTSFSKFSALTHLSIRGRGAAIEHKDSSTSAQSPKSPAEAFVDCLRGMPLLQTLILRRVLPSAPHAKPHLWSESSISLHNLKLLRIRDTFTSCSWLLGSLDIPFLKTALEIHATVEDAEDYAEASGLLQFLSSYVPRINPPDGICKAQVFIQFHQLSIDIWPGLGVDGKTMEEGVNDSYQMEASPFLRLCITLPPFDESDSFAMRYSLLPTILAACPLPNLRLLKLSIDPEVADLQEFVDYHFWRSFYGPCANANAIQVQGAATVTLLPLLATRKVPGWKLSDLLEPRAPLFPTLKALSVGKVGSGSLEEAIGYCMSAKNANYHNREQRHIAFVRKCLATRDGQAPPLERLYIDMDEDLRWLGNETADSLKNVAKIVDSGVYDW